MDTSGRRGPNEALRKHREGRNARQLASFAGYVRRCVCADTLTIDPTESGAVLVRATWDGGSYEREYPVSEIARVCHTRRSIIGDILRARGIGPRRDGAPWHGKQEPSP